MPEFRVSEISGTQKHLFPDRILATGSRTCALGRQDTRRPSPTDSISSQIASFPMSHIVAIARTWLGTPYHHQASARGVGTDCIGLIRGIYRELYGREAEAAPSYSRDWAEASGEETLLSAARRHLAEIAPDAAAPGDVLVFRYRGRTVAKHAAIMASPTTMIHAIEGAPVSEVTLSPWWRRHLAGAFRFPLASPSPRTSLGEEGVIGSSMRASR
jgi:NlpC/P60 family putative phage cell wall peptidase